MTNSKMNSMSKAPRGFTLIELMLVVVIIGILAALAIPSYSRYALTARLGEAPSILSAMATGENNYIMQNNNAYTTPTSAPVDSTVLGTNKVVWAQEQVDGFAPLNVTAQGATYCKYQAAANGQNYTLMATCNVDGTGDAAVFCYYHVNGNVLGNVVTIGAQADGGPGCGGQVQNDCASGTNLKFDEVCKNSGPGIF